MELSEIQSNVKRIKAELATGNPFGEKVLLVAATKTQSADAINAAIDAGVDAVAENKVQEFREKHEFLKACPQHFIGHLQTNKVKYLVGNVALFHSCDRDELASEISAQSVRRGVLSEVLVQVNIGREDSKGGYAPESAYESYRRLYEKAKGENPDVAYLSMGMSGDYRLCVAHGSNMVRLGSTIFGARG